MNGSGSAQTGSAIAGLVLCGGRSSRMGGGDKALLPLAGTPLLGWTIRRFGPQVSRLAINANGDAARFRAFGLPVVADTVEGFAGPLAGILAGMGWARSLGLDAVLTVPGDSPFIPPDLAARLAAAAAPGRVAVARSGGRRHPVVALWPTALHDGLAAFLAADGSRRVNDFLSRQTPVEVDFGPVYPGTMPVDPFFNVNTPQDLAEAQRLVEGRPS